MGQPSPEPPWPAPGPSTPAGPPPSAWGPPPPPPAYGPPPAAPGGWQPNPYHPPGQPYGQPAGPRRPGGRGGGKIAAIVIGEDPGGFSQDYAYTDTRLGGAGPFLVVTLRYSPVDSGDALQQAKDDAHARHAESSTYFIWR